MRWTMGIFNENIDDRAIKPGDTCTEDVVKVVINAIGDDISHHSSEREYGTVIQNIDAYASLPEYVGKKKLYHTFLQTSDDKPIQYRGLCEEGKIRNMSPWQSKHTFIISQYRAHDDMDESFNSAFACALARSLFIASGDLAIVPHLYFPSFMYDEGFERDFAIEAGHKAMEQCDNVILAIIDGYMSEGMESDLDFATMDLALPVKRLDFTKEEAKTLIEEARNANYEQTGDQYR